MELGDWLGHQLQPADAQGYSIKCGANPQGTRRKASAATWWTAKGSHCHRSTRPCPTENATLVFLDPGRKQGRGLQPQSQEGEEWPPWPHADVSSSSLHLDMALPWAGSCCQNSIRAPAGEAREQPLQTQPFLTAGLSKCPDRLREGSVLGA